MHELLERAQKRILKQTGHDVILVPVYKSSMNADFSGLFIIDTVCQVYDTTLKTLKSDCKPTIIAKARWTCAILLKRFFPRITLKQIGAYLNKDHTAVMHALTQGNLLLEKNEDAEFVKNYNLAVQKIIKKYNEA